MKSAIDLGDAYRARYREIVRLPPPPQSTSPWAPAFEALWAWCKSTAELRGGSPGEVALVMLDGFCADPWCVTRQLPLRALAQDPGRFYARAIASRELEPKLQRALARRPAALAGGNVYELEGLDEEIAAIRRQIREGGTDDGR